MYSYQKGKSTESALHHVTHKIEKAFVHKEIAIITFIDIEGAFNNSEFTVIRSSMKKKSISKSILNGQHQYLNKKIYVHQTRKVK